MGADYRTFLPESSLYILTDRSAFAIVIIRAPANRRRLGVALAVGISLSDLTSIDLTK
jgi:hypothetical protein